MRIPPRKKERRGRGRGRGGGRTRGNRSRGNPATAPRHQGESTGFNFSPLSCSLIETTSPPKNSLQHSFFTGLPLFYIFRYLAHSSRSLCLLCSTHWRGRAEREVKKREIEKLTPVSVFAMIIGRVEQFCSQETTRMARSSSAVRILVEGRSRIRDESSCKDG
jgi:hypothetical protein